MPEASFYKKKPLNEEAKSLKLPTGIDETPKLIKSEEGNELISTPIAVSTDTVLVKGDLLVDGDVKSNGTTLTGGGGSDANTTYTISTADGLAGSKKIIRLTGSDSSTDDVTLVAGTGITLSQSSDEITITNSVTDTDTVLSTEQVQDIVGAMFTGNTETRISATYEDGDGTIDLVADDMTSDSTKLPLSGGTMTGDLIIEADNKIKSDTSGSYNFIEFDDDSGSPENQTLISSVTNVVALCDGNNNGTGHFEVLKGGTDSTATELFRVENDGDGRLAGDLTITSGHTYKVGTNDVLNQTTLGSTVVNSSLTSVGTISTGTWNGTAIASAYLDSDTAHLSGTQTFTGEKTFNAHANFEATKNIYFDGSGGQNVYINASDSSTMNIGVDGEDKVTITDSVTKLINNPLLIRESGSASSDEAQFGQIWIKNDTPNNLYFTDDSGQDIAITANGHLAQKHIIQINARYYNRYNHWFYPTFAWGTNAENWNSTRSSTSLETTWFDSWNPQLVVPHNMTLNEYRIYGNATATHTIEHALLHGTGVTWDDTNADNFSLAQIGSTQSGDWTSGRYNDLGQTGLSVDLTKGDMIMPAARRTTGDTSSTYSYLEICFVAVCTLR